MNALNKEILRLAIPSILANITVPIVGMVDIAVAGHLHGSSLFTAAAFIGGISIGSMLFDLLYWNFAFLRVGTGGLTAQAFGREDPAECGRIFLRGFALALAAAVGNLIIGNGICSGGLILILFILRRNVFISIVHPFGGSDLLGKIFVI